MSKLTLSIDEGVVTEAKRYAQSQGTSISAMVESYLAAIARPQTTTDAPILQSLRGSLKKGDIEEHRKHLSSKYR